MIEQAREIVTAALREAAEAVMDQTPVFYKDESDEWANDKVARWLRARADYLDELALAGDEDDLGDNG